MNAEKTMEFILQQQATFEANLVRSNQRLDRVEGLLERTIRVGLQWRRETQKWRTEAEQRLANLEGKMSETMDKLNALIDVVDRGLRRAK